MKNIEKLLVKYNIKQEDILAKLCWYDKRNPDNMLEEIEEKDRNNNKGQCYCDNCFYGRSEFAKIILELL